MHRGNGLETAPQLSSYTPQLQLSLADSIKFFHRLSLSDCNGVFFDSPPLPHLRFIASELWRDPSSSDRDAHQARTEPYVMALPDLYMTVRGHCDI